MKTLLRSRSEQGLTVAAPEQEREPAQVATQLIDLIASAADETTKGLAEPVAVTGKPVVHELQQLGELNGVINVQGHSRHRVRRPWPTVSVDARSIAHRPGMRTALVTADRYRIFAITCPFALTNREGRARTLSRFLDEPDAGSYALFMEHIATAINPRQGLMGGKRLAELLRAAPDQAATLAAFQARLDAEPAAVYDVRRVLRPRKDDPDRLANAVRYTVAIDAGTRADMRTVLAELAAKHDTTVSTADRHERVWIRQRDGQLPDLEWCYVIAPGVVPNKIGPGFDEAWEHAAAAAMTRPRRTALC